MGTLHDRLAELADDAPTGGAPAAELWARGRRAHRLRAAALVATVLVVCAVGAGIGVRLTDGGDDRSAPVPASTIGIALPIRYPTGEDLPELGEAPGPLVAVWLVPSEGGGAPEAVGLVAETGTFGTLPIEVDRMYEGQDAYFALSPDGRRIAYTPRGTVRDDGIDMTVHDLVTGETYSPVSELKTRPGYTWVDATHLVGYEPQGGDADGWVWSPGGAPELVDLTTYPQWHDHLGSYSGKAPTWFQELDPEGDPRSCLSLRDMGGGVRQAVLCDVVGVISSEIALTHDGDGTVVALDIRGVEDPALRHVVASAGAPRHVTFATDVIRAALDAAGGAS